MKLRIDDLILKELDRQRFSASNISFIFNKLNNIDKKNEFLLYLVNNRCVLLNFKDIMSYIKELS